MQLLKETKAIAMTRDRIDLPLGGDRALVFRRDPTDPGRFEVLLASVHRTGGGTFTRPLAPPLVLGAGDGEALLRLLADRGA